MVVQVCMGRKSGRGGSMIINIEVKNAALDDLYWLDELREYIKQRPEVEEIHITIRGMGEK